MYIAFEYFYLWQPFVSPPVAIVTLNGKITLQCGSLALAVGYEYIGNPKLARPSHHYISPRLQRPLLSGLSYMEQPTGPHRLRPLKKNNKVCLNLLRTRRTKASGTRKRSDPQVERMRRKWTALPVCGFSFMCAGCVAG